MGMLKVMILDFQEIDLPTEKGTGYFVGKVACPLSCPGI
jgi:hypothetical protein